MTGRKMVAVQGMEKSQLGSASGLFSTVRNVGGAIGIAVASQIVVEREKLHAMRIGEVITSFSLETQERIIALVRRFGGLYVERFTALHGATTEPLRQQALAVLDSLVHREARLLAYSDTFLIAGAAMTLCTFAAFLLKGAAGSPRSWSARRAKRAAPD